LFTIGKSIFGRVQLKGLSLVAKPPARITVFKCVAPNRIADLYSVGS
jgi:hypothetical protein